uniref:Uncharacterized protein n=1 Tax=Marseillevirus LCMAC101 TaxID=2506602 RepID=A0A481YSD7_9VIRU|nr:MAG: hypothetical protein LCMAC101_07370 [Marseillevirus LCMAC101]
MSNQVIDNRQNPAVKCVSSSKLPLCDESEASVTVTRVASQVIPTGAATDVSFDTVSRNDGFAIGTLPVSSVSIPFRGLYLLVGNAHLQNSSTFDIFFQNQISVNGTGIAVQREFNGSNTSDDFRNNATAVAQLNQGDVITMSVTQTDAGDRNLLVDISDLSITRLRAS